MPAHSATNALAALNDKLAAKLKVASLPLHLMDAAEYDKLPDADKPHDVYVRRPGSITFYPAKTAEQTEEPTHYGSGGRGLADLYLDHYHRQQSLPHPGRAAMFLALNPDFWALRTLLDLPAGRLPFGRILQNIISTAALLLLLAIYVFPHTGIFPPKPIALYMGICFTLALSSISRIGDLWDDWRAGRRLRPDFAQQLGFLLAALSPCYYYAHLSHSLLEKPIQYTLLSTTAAAVFMSFLITPKS